MDRGYVVERKTHPKDTAGIWSLLSFTYIYSYIRKGNQRDLNEDDICKVWTKFKSKNMGDRIEKLWDEQEVEKGKHKSIYRLLFACFWKQYLLLGLFQLIVKVAYIALAPASVGKLVNYFKEGQTEITKNEAWMHASIVIFVSSAFLFYEHHYILLKSEFGIRIIGSLASLVYRKALKLSPSKLAEISTGRIVIAITKDITLIEEASYFLNDLWVEVIQASVAMYLLYLKLGPSGVSGLSIVLIIVTIQVYIAGKVFKKRQEANSRSDERLQLTQEVITAIRVMKMYAWEKFFAGKIIDARKSEIRNIRTLLIWRFLSSFLGNLCNKLAFLFVILFYIWFGNNLTAEVVYFVTICFQRLRRTIAFIIPFCSGCIAEFIACAKRIEVIMNTEEIEDYNIHDQPESVIIPKIDFVSADIGVSEIRLLKNINMKLRPGLNVMIGPVGCGKSSLIKAILREYVILDGKVNIEGTISYSPQAPWVFPSSIKQNILFGQTYDEKKYKTVLEVCALKFDLDGLAQGDETVLNDCGVNLSKGQQARVNIARALYKNSDIYIFDDSLSSLDSHVKNYIFQNTIQGYLKDKMVILATHDTKFVSQADNVIIMLDRTVTYTGKPTNIPLKVTQSLESLDKDLCESDEENDKEDKEVDEEKCNETSELIKETCTSNKANIYHETLFTGGVGWKYYKKYFQFGGGFFMFFTVFAIFIIVEVLSGFSEKLLSRWVTVEEQITPNSSKIGIFNVTSSNPNSYITQLTEDYTTTPYQNEEFNQSTEITESFTTNYQNTISAGLIIVNKKMQDLMVDLATLLSDRQYYINWYSALIVLSCVLSFVGVVSYFIFSLKVSKNLHKAMITNVLCATMSFFDKNMSGNILNRFSKDLFNIDEWIPYIFLEAIRMITMMTSTGLLIATISFSFTGLTLLLVVIFFVACRYCIRPARTLRRIDMATRSPMVGHLNATLDGLITIRAYGTQSVLINEFDKHQDHFMAAHHLFEILMRCLSFSLHMISAVYIATLIIGFMIQEGASSSNVGLAITQSFVLSNFLDWGLRQWVMMESIMTNFQRSSEYAEVKQEMETGQTIENWPSEGAIKYRNVSLTYRENNETVLKNLNFSINPKEKIGIVGRTGAGKSSIIVTLFRLYEVEGNILIDDVDIKTLSLDHLRNHVAIIPQDPIIFSGSVRTNIDPLNKYSDNEIWQALSAVNLKSAIKDLSQEVHETGLTYSVGQRQLLCLARAIIRKTKIIILDEATANMDEETDQFIHNKIEELFRDCTTITVAHRLNSVMQCNRVLVMDKGEIIEFDHPYTLLKNKDSMFYKMVHHHDNS